MELKEYFHQRYQGRDSFLENVIFPIFGEENFDDGYDEGGYDTLGEMLNFHSSTKKGCKKKDIVKRRKKNKNKKTHR